MAILYTTFPRTVNLFWEPYQRGRQCRLQPLICTGPAMVELNRHAARDEKAKTGEGTVGVAGMPLREVLYFSELAEIGGAHVTVSRTHTGLSLYCQIDTF